MSRCPHCGFEAVTLSKEWRYSVFNVKKFNCPNCGKWFREYYYKGVLKFILVPAGKGRLKKFEGR